MIVIHKIYFTISIKPHSSISKKFFPYQASSSLTLCTLAEGRIFLCTDSCFSSIRILIGNVPPKISLLKVWNSASYFRKTLNLGTHLVMQEVLLIGGLPYGGIWRLFFAVHCQCCWSQAGFHSCADLPCTLYFDMFTWGHRSQSIVAINNGLEKHQTFLLLKQTLFLVILKILESSHMLLYTEPCFRI